MARTVPLHGRLEDRIAEFAMWRRRARADGRIDHVEAVEGLALAEAMVEESRRATKTMRFVATVMGSSDGLDSPSVGKALEERQAERVWEVPALELVPA